MIPNLALRTLSEQEIADIHAAMLTVLSRTGMAVEHEGLRAILAEHGAELDAGSGRVRFPVALVERFLADAERVAPPAGPRISANVPLYQGPYLEPGTNRLIPFTGELVARYFKLARLLGGLHRSMLNFPPAAARPTEPLEMRVFAWKHGVHEAGSIQRTSLCPYLLELYEILAAARAKPVPELFRGTVYVVGPLKLGATEAEQILFFRQRGLRVRIGNMLTMGGTAPVTMAGAVALHLAERVAIGLIDRALFGSRTWSMGGPPVPLDMRTLMMPYGRPELLLGNLACMQLARHYGVGGGTHGGLSDAKRPSYEAGVQKLMTALPCALAGGASIQAGLLSIDEVFSPIQMILDAELTSALRRIVKGFDVNADTLATEVIEAVGPGGVFTAELHTAAHFREELWEPMTWSREMAQAWLAGEKKIDVDRALDIWHELMARPDPDPELDEATERRLRRVIERAGGRV
ncbi:MAG: trimethylamine methyltransferase family protein [Kiritimatiellae bacterium]|nr:trimethylamine methyltransferase family protein [Kiritimatiellia bacterium]